LPPKVTTPAPRLFLRYGDADKDRPLREDTRLLGRILGDPVREQRGERPEAVPELDFEF
jgi:hypothetical protein